MPDGVKAIDSVPTATGDTVLSGEPVAHSSEWRLYSLILLMTMMWSFNYIVAKVALREFPPMLASSMRMTIAGIAMFPVYLIYSSRGLAGWARKDLPKLLSLGILGVGLNQILFVVGIAHTSVAHAGIMIALCPVLVLLLAWAMGMESLGPTKLLGLLVAIIGVLVIQLASRSNRTSSLLGDSLIFAASIAFALFSVNAKLHAKAINGITLNTFAFVGTGLLMIPVIVWQGANFPFHQVSILAWISLFYMAVFSSVLSYVIFFYALRRIPASRVAAFSYLQPVLATLMAIPLLGEHLTSSLIVGGLLVMGGVLLVERI